MDLFLGRQPIVDRDQNVVGYELLSRRGTDGLSNNLDPITDGFEDVVEALIANGLDSLVGDKPAFVQFDRRLLLGDLAMQLPSDRIIVELPGSVDAAAEILTACQMLRSKGYRLALADCGDDERTRRFMPIVDILKVDIQSVAAGPGLPGQQFRNPNCQLLARRIETREAFDRARQLGCQYVHGYFFVQPAQNPNPARVQPSNMGAMRLIRLIQQTEIDFRAVEEIVRYDVSFSFSLLRYLNSAGFTWSSPIESVRQGLVLLGESNIRQWAWMAVLPALDRRRSPALIAQALFRGRFCELIGAASGHCHTGADPFLFGMASLFDAIRERPLGEVLNELNFSTRMQEALTGAPSDDPFSRMLSVVKAYERGEWSSRGDEVVGLNGQELHELYLTTLAWVDLQVAQFSAPARRLNPVRRS